MLSPRNKMRAGAAQAGPAIISKAHRKTTTRAVTRGLQNPPNNAGTLLLMRAMTQSPVSIAAGPSQAASAPAEAIGLSGVHLTLAGPAGPVNILRGVDLSVSAGAA